MDRVLFDISLGFYLISTSGYLAALLIKRVFVARISTWLLAGAFAFHTAALLAQHLLSGQTILAGLFASLSFFAWAVTGSYLLFQLRTKTIVLGAIVSPLVLLLNVTSSLQFHRHGLLPQILQGPLVTAHVVLSLMGEALFVLVALAGMLYLLQDYNIRHRRLHAMSRLLPPLKDLDQINHLGLLIGFPILTLGLLTGSVWAAEVWGSHWPWDPKLTWAFFFWLGYAFLLHQRLAIGWSGRRSAFCAVVFLFLMLASLSVVGLLLPTIHTFR